MVKTLTLERYHELAVDYFETSPHLTLGQAYFMMLAMLDADLAESFKNSKYDPFFKEDNELKPFFMKIKELWQNQEGT
jgi:hypothetical protein